MGEFKRQRWEAAGGASSGSGKRPPAQYYRAFIPDRIADIEVAFPAPVAMLVAQAERAIALVGVGQPDSDKDLLRSLLPGESVQTQKIDGVTLPGMAAYSESRTDGAQAQTIPVKFVAGKPRSSSAPRKKWLTPEQIEELHEKLSRDAKDPDEDPGRFRTVQTWMGGSDESPVDADYVPPPPSEVVPLAEDLCDFVARTDVSPIVLAAVAYAQVQAILPFVHGNRKVGLALVHAILRERGVETNYVPPLSHVLQMKGAEITEGLSAYRDGDIARWCGTFADALRQASLKAKELSNVVANAPTD